MSQLLEISHKYVPSVFKSTVRVHSYFNILKKQMKKWLEYFHSKTNPDDLIMPDQFKEFANGHIRDNTKCPFLVNDTCGIYEVRPLACRTYIVNDSPEICRNQPFRNGITDIQQPTKLLRDHLFRLSTQVNPKLPIRPFPACQTESFDLSLDRKIVYVMQDSDEARKEISQFRSQLGLPNK